MHHYPFHPGDYLKDTAYWSEDRAIVEVEAGLVRDLAYRRLLDLYYGEEEPIPSKTRLVAIRIRMLKHEEIVASVLKEKFSLIDGFWRQKRVDEEVANYQRRAAASRENGKKGGRPKNPAKPGENPAGSGQVATKNHKPRTRTRNTPLSPTGELGDGFAAWWDVYPLKVAKQDALKAWMQLLPDAALMAAITEATARQVASGHFTNLQGVVNPPYPATWLRARRWEDEVTPRPAAAPGPAATPGPQSLSPAGEQTLRNAAAAAERLFPKDQDHGPT